MVTTRTLIYYHNVLSHLPLQWPSFAPCSPNVVLIYYSPIWNGLYTSSGKIYKWYLNLAGILFPGWPDARVSRHYLSRLMCYTSRQWEEGSARYKLEIAGGVNILIYHNLLVEPSYNYKQYITFWLAINSTVTSCKTAATFILQNPLMCLRRHLFSGITGMFIV